MDRRYVFLAVFIVYIALMVVGALITVTAEGVITVNGIDKLIHFAEFFAFSLIMFNVLQLFKVKRIYIAGIVIGVVFIVLSEIIQAFVPQRILSYYDMIADAAGFIIGLIVFRLAFYKKMNESEFNEIKKK